MWKDPSPSAFSRRHRAEMTSICPSSLEVSYRKYIFGGKLSKIQMWGILYISNLRDFRTPWRWMGAEPIVHTRSAERLVYHFKRSILFAVPASHSKSWKLADIVVCSRGCKQPTHVRSTRGKRVVLHLPEPNLNPHGSCVTAPRYKWWLLLDGLLLVQRTRLINPDIWIQDKIHPSWI